MKRALLSSAAAVALFAISSSAFAADLMIDTPIGDAPMASGSLDGVYLGIFGTTYPNAGPAEYGIGVELGYNFTAAESFLLGVEASGVFYPTGYDPEVWLKGKAGFTADSFAIYGFGEIGGYFGAPFTPQYGVGAGAEFLVTDSISIAAEVGLREDLGVALTTNNLHAQIGARFHF